MSSENVGLQIEILESSFQKVAPDADSFITSFYDNLFTDYPAAKPLFAHTNMKRQGQMLLKSLVFVVENLRNPGALTETLQGLGARHVKYGALPEHYPLVGNTLLKTFGEYLGSDWTDEVKAAWAEAYGVITEIMLEGADYEAKDIALDSDPPNNMAANPGGGISLVLLPLVLGSGTLAIIGLILLGILL